MLAWRRVDRCADELGIGQFDAIFGGGFAQGLDIVVADLVAESATAGVDHDGYLAGLELEELGSDGIVDFIDGLDLDEMIAGSERATLVVASLLGVGTNGAGVGAGKATSGLGVFEVGSGTKSTANRVGGTLGQETTLGG